MEWVLEKNIHDNDKMSSRKGVIKEWLGLKELEINQSENPFH